MTSPSQNSSITDPFHLTVQLVLALVMVTPIFGCQAEDSLGLEHGHSQYIDIFQESGGGGDMQGSSSGASLQDGFT